MFTVCVLPCCFLHSFPLVPTAITGAHRRTCLPFLSDNAAHTAREQPLTVSHGRNTATMAAPQSNGRAKKTSKPKANGYLNGSPNVGSTNGSLNGHADKSQSSSVTVRQRKRRRTFTGAITSIVLRSVFVC